MRFWTVLIAALMALSLNITPVMADGDKDEHGKKYEAKHDKNKDKKDHEKANKHHGDKDEHEAHKPFLRDISGS